MTVPVLNPKTMTYDERKRLAYDTLDYIKAHPEDWNQGEWRCSTGMCYAGWLVTLAGGTWKNQADNDYDFSSYLTDAVLVPLPGEEPDPTTLTGVDDGPYVHASTRACALLGIGVRTDTSAHLFNADNGIVEIGSQLDEIFEGRQ